MLTEHSFPFLNCRMKISLTEGSDRQSQKTSQYIWVCPVCPTSSLTLFRSARSAQIPPPSPAQPLYLSLVSTTYRRGSEETKAKSIISLGLGCPGITFTLTSTRRNNPIDTNISRKPMPNLKVQGSDPLIHQSKLQDVTPELRSYK